MYILLAAATPFEIKPFSTDLESTGFQMGPHKIEVLITGIGPMLTAFSLAKAIFRKKPDFMIQAGIAGSFTPNFSPPQVVIVKNEMMGDLGAAENGGFSDVFDLNLAERSLFPFNNKQLNNPLTGESDSLFDLKTARGITVNEISTSGERIELLKNKYLAETESMEGAAFHYAGLTENIPFLQLRAISNIVGDRNKQTWRMKEAIIALNNALINILPQLK